MCPSLSCLPACLKMWVYDIFKILCLYHSAHVTKRLLIIASLTSQMARLPFFCGRFAIKPDDKKLSKTRLPQITLKFMQQKESYLSWPVHCIFTTKGYLWSRVGFTVQHNLDIHSGYGRTIYTNNCYHLRILQLEFLSKHLFCLNMCFPLCLLLLQLIKYFVYSRGF